MGINRLLSSRIPDCCLHNKPGANIRASSSAYLCSILRPSRKYSQTQPARTAPASPDWLCTPEFRIQGSDWRTHFECWPQHGWWRLLPPHPFISTKTEKSYTQTTNNIHTEGMGRRILYLQYLWDSLRGVSTPVCLLLANFTSRRLCYITHPRGSAFHPRAWKEKYINSLYLVTALASPSKSWTFTITCVILRPFTVQSNRFPQALQEIQYMYLIFGKQNKIHILDQSTCSWFHRTPNKWNDYCTTHSVSLAVLSNRKGSLYIILFIIF